ncbi:MAG: acyl-[ACP]--phospholipid O-acyltransferase [Alphaproteobacteria bacterium]|nr:acyl-[ACP]--phospholipid O-acyltransferase [Alphaproteobacteria bacterium]
MHDSSVTLLARRRFLPLFASQFLGAVNDNLFKNAIVVLVVYRIGAGGGLAPEVLVTLAAGAFILPFVLLSAMAGQLSDRFDKSLMIRMVKLCEIPVTLLGAAALLVGNVWFLLAALFLLGVQATFFGPLKYAVLPEYLAEGELVDGNALIEGGTFLAILVGTIAGGLLILADNGPLAVAALMTALAVAGYLASLFLPPAHGGNPSVRVSANPFAETWAILRDLGRERDVFLSVLGISWFWFVGATFLAQFPAFAKDVLHADEHAVTLMLTMFSLGIGLGSLLCARMLDGEISARHVPFAALGMSLFAFDLAAAAHGLQGAGALATIDQFLLRPVSWRVLADLLGLAVCGGIYIVPLYVILQARTPEDRRARTIGANNIVNALFMVASAAVGAGLLAAGLGVTQVFLAAAIANLAVAAYICGLLPDAVVKGILAAALRVAFRVRLVGGEHLKSAGPGSVIVVNHVSFLDAVLLVAFLPGRPTFAVNTFVARLWWVRPFLRLVDAFPLDPTNPLSTKSLIRAVEAGRSCVIFPEGRITVTGSLMKVYEGPGAIADHADAPIVPIRIDGAQYTRFSRLKGRVRLRWFPPIALTILPPRRFQVAPGLKGRARRQAIGQALYDVMSAMMFETADRERTLFEALLDARAVHGARAHALEDINRKPLGYGRLVLGSLALGRALARGSAPGDAVGVLLPNAVGAAVAFFGLQYGGRVPAMLNFSAGAGSVLAACRAAGLKTVLTSRRFVAQAQLEPLVAALSGAVQVTYLEDVARRIGTGARLLALLKRPVAGLLHRRHGRRPGDPAVILFTSGSEGTPKGVALSHANILANCNQLAARIDFSPADIVFNALPVFHSFGLTGGLLLPVLSGVKCFLYPSPLHYRIVPELAYDTNASILFGTDTFLAGYARAAHAYDFYSLRYVFAGAEKVKDETRRTWADKFGLRILEGYGATETAPALATNTPMHFRAGTVGRLLPGIAHRLEPVPGIAEGGRLLVSGPNVMLGYLKADRPGVIEPPEGGWYDTGDIVTIDADGYLRIVGRLKRFAKIAGEMVPLGRVEAEVASLWPGSDHAVVALPDARKGEQLVLLTTRPDAGREALAAHFRSAGMAELTVPRTLLVVDALPLLGTGKTDYVTAAALARERVADAG